MSKNNKWQLIVDGIVKNNPTFVLVLGMCPTLGTTTSAINGLGMGLATTIVLILSNITISAIAKIIPDKVRIPSYIVVIASFVTIVDLLMQAYLPSLHQSLGIFIPLIVVNCIILGRAEAFANKNPVLYSIADGIGIGIGFTVSLVIIAFAREFLAEGSITVWGNLAWKDIHNWKMVLFILPAGGFVMLGLILAFINRLQAWAAQRHGETPPMPLDMDCRHCSLCHFGK